MKRILFSVTLLSLTFISGSFQKPLLNLTGAWHWKEEDEETIVIFIDGYTVIAEFNQVNHAFWYTAGGSYREKNGQVIVTGDFSTTKQEKEKIGLEGRVILSLQGDKLHMTYGDSTKKTFTQLDDGSGEMAGLWRITGRMANGQMNEIKDGPRKTIKILTSKRFQWIAFNSETSEFFGTGGGNYTFKDGKYTENIEFFSRDPDRVGTSQTFEASINNKTWTHKGNNSRGEAIHEEWKRDSR